MGKLSQSKILIVDDVPENVRLLSDMLGNLGYETRGAINGATAIMGATADPPDLILLDVSMPIMDGFEVCKTLKGNTQTSDIPIIFISAFGEIIDKVKAFDVGGSDYMTKPYNSAELLARVRHQLELGSLRKELESKNQNLQDMLIQLKATQAELIQSAKMAALGSLVAGVAHEINTPMGASLISASTLEAETEKIKSELGKNTLKRSALQDYLHVSTECSQIVLANLQRAGELVQSFKKMAVDQMNLQIRHVALRAYLEEILVSLKPTLKQFPHSIEIIGGEDLTIKSYPGALSQIMSNLILNSFIHAYPNEEVGHIQVRLSELDSETIVLHYSDDGCGIPEENISKIFEPFFTTARYQNRGDGLGLHLVYNLVHQKLKGSIEVQSSCDWGTSFMIKIPKSLNPPAESH